MVCVICLVDTARLMEKLDIILILGGVSLQQLEVKLCSQQLEVKLCSQRLRLGNTES